MCHVKIIDQSFYIWMSHVTRALLTRSRGNPGTAMIPYHQFNKTEQHMHKWTEHKTCPVRISHVTLMNAWCHIRMSHVPHANTLFQIMNDVTHVNGSPHARTRHVMSHMNVGRENWGWGLGVRGGRAKQERKKFVKNQKMICDVFY